ncbi:hypothetical protein D4R75_05140 [bacterium]|nr:MAG: hypothetical protein D4R75_05140 [bacterium]
MLTGSEFEITRDSQQWYQGTISLKADVSPKQADVASTESASSRYVGKQGLAIYELRKGATFLSLQQMNPM